MAADDTAFKFAYPLVLAGDAAVTEESLFPMMNATENLYAAASVFASEFGTPADPRNILRTIQIAAQKAGMTDVGVHTLRHSAAVAWLEAGVHIKAVADLLGHSSIAITGDIYGHTSDDTARAAVDALSDALGL